MNKSIIDTRISHPGKTRRARLLLAAAAGLSLAALTTARAAVMILHNFTGGVSDGSFPYGSLTLSGSKLYGMTSQGGSGNPGGLSGTVFSMNTDGTGYSLLHSFLGGVSDGAEPQGSLTLSGSKLYGVTKNAGSNNGGTVFSMNTDGTGYSLLHSFSTAVAGGNSPGGTLTLSGSKLYGVTSGGDGFYRGAIFSMNTDGTGFEVHHLFTGGPTDGDGAVGLLTLTGSKLYGMTNSGGSGGNGTIFSINTDGTGYGLLHNFTGGAGDGAFPRGSLTLSGSTFYGLTQGFGGSDGGSLFRMNTDGTGFSVLHSFTGGVNDGYFPLGSLTLSGSTLYGMTYSGGTSNRGTLFSIDTDGTGFALLESFGIPGFPQFGELTLSDDASTLYGMTYAGGTANRGVVFARAIPEPGALALLGPGTLLLAARRRMRIVPHFASKSPARFHSPTAGMC